MLNNNAYTPFMYQLLLIIPDDLYKKRTSLWVAQLPFFPAQRAETPEQMAAVRFKVDMASHTC